MCECEYKITNGVPVSECEFTVYVYVCVCVIEVGARVRECRPNGSLLLDRFVVDIYKFL